MGNQKRKWVAEEEEALRRGVAKLGAGKWKAILCDPEFAPSLANRSNIDLKDKWRNIGEGSKDRLQSHQVEAVPAPRNSTAPSATRAPGALADDAAADGARDDPSNGLHDSRNPLRYDELIFEALSAVDGSNGADVGEIFNYMETREELPPNFRRKLRLRLGKLFSQGKLEKAGRNYRIIRDTTTSETEPTTPKQNDVRTKPIQAPSELPSYAAIQEAAMAAADIIAEAEYRSFLAAEAVEESERVSKMADDTVAVLQLILMQFYRPGSSGEISVPAWHVDCS